jgi:hypothetical protein
MAAWNRFIFNSERILLTTEILAFFLSYFTVFTLEQLSAGFIFYNVKLKIKPRYLCLLSHRATG